LVPVAVVDVGAEVQGRIVAFGPDLDNAHKLIDYRSRVEVGTVLARIEDALYADDVTAAKVDLVEAEREVKRFEIELAKAKGKLSASKDLEIDAFLVKIAEANLAKARASREKARVLLTKANYYLDYCTIRSPVKGVIIDRRVNIGQTVVSSLSAPSLFLIAKDLNRIQVWATVNEADIGRIHTGQKAFFKVDAWPGDVFEGKVSQIRFNATMTNNVVTYTVVVDTKNVVDPVSEELKLSPYLTANLQFRVAELVEIEVGPTKE
jgi:HlyD family secretion protein